MEENARKSTKSSSNSKKGQLGKRPRQGIELKYEYEHETETTKEKEKNKTSKRAKTVDF